MRCQIDAECYEASLRWGLETYAKQVSIDKSDFKASDDVVNEWKSVILVMENERATRETVGGAPWTVSLEYIPLGHCAFHVQYVWPSQSVRDGEADSASTVVISVRWMVAQFEPGQCWALDCSATVSR